MNHLVILVHGINTHAFWMEEIRPSLEKAGFSVSLTGYGMFGVLPFLSYFSKQRENAIKRVVRNIRLARKAYVLENEREPERISVISHSFGTYVISRILTDYPEFMFYRLIFCGSVVKDDFAFDEGDVIQRFKPPLLNEAGTRDYWPALAESAGWGYGSVGDTGFPSPIVETRWHKGFAHSDFLKEDFCDKFWVPFLLGQPPLPADHGQELPRWIRAISSLPLKWLFLPQTLWLLPAILVLGTAYFCVSSSRQLEVKNAMRHPSILWQTSPKPNLGTAITNGDATVKGVKIVLKEIDYYSGEINDEHEIEYYEAVRKFERESNIAVDEGYVGPGVLEALKKRSIPDLEKKLKTK